MTKMQPDSLHGHLRRSEQAQDRRKQALQYTKELCQNAWDAFIKEHQSSEVITNKQIYSLYEALIKRLKSAFQRILSHLHYSSASAFSIELMMRIKKDTCRSLPKPIIAVHPQRTKNINDFETFLYLSTAQVLSPQAFDKWQQKNTFSFLDSVNSFLFSLISFAGYNDEKLLKDV